MRKKTSNVHIPVPSVLPDSGIVNDNWTDAMTLAAELEISPRTLDRMCDNGLVYSKALGRRYFLQSEVHLYLLANEKNRKKRKR